MKRPLLPDIPRRALAAVLALALLASMVAGREPSSAPRSKDVGAPRVDTAPERTDVRAEDLDMDGIAGRVREREIPDLFAGRSWAPVPPLVVNALPPPKPEPLPPPSAPPLPFRYLGRLVDGAKVVVFLEKNQEALSVAAGDRIESLYQVEGIEESAVHFIYLPLGARQTLSVSAPN